jgi:hypothetical protein
VEVSIGQTRLSALQANKIVRVPKALVSRDLVNDFFDPPVARLTITRTEQFIEFSDHLRIVVIDPTFHVLVF